MHLLGPEHLVERVVDTFVRRWLLFTATVLAVVVGATGLLLLKARTYVAAASARVVGDETAAVLGTSPGGGMYVTNKAQQHAQRLRDLLEDNGPGGFLEQSLKQAQLATPISLDPRARDPRFAMLLKQVRVEAPSDSLLTVSLTWPNAVECERIATALRDQYIEEASQGKQRESLATEKFLDSQIEIYARRMREAERALIEHRQGNFTRSPEAEVAELKQLSALREELEGLKITSAENELQRKAHVERLNEISRTSIFEQTVTDDPATRKLRELETERAELLTEYRPESDEVKAIDAKIAALRQVQQQARGGNGVGSAVVETKQRDNPEYRATEERIVVLEIARKTQAARMAVLQRRIRDLEAHIRAIPDAQRQLNDKTRDYDILKNQFERLLVSREQARVKGNLDRVTARSAFVTMGLVHAQPSMPRKKLLMMCMASLIAGVILAAGLVIVREWMDPAVRYVDDAERLFGVPLLGAIYEQRTLPVFSVAGQLRDPGTAGALPGGQTPASNS